MCTIKKTLKSAKIDSSEAVLLMAHTTGQSREHILAHSEHELSPEQYREFQKACTERAEGKPIAYIVGEKEFYGRAFAVNKHTLIPRPETEILVERVLSNLLYNKLYNKNFSVIDVGTGSGNIIISIAKEMQSASVKIQNAHFYGIDISRDALAVARKNAKRHGVHDSIRFIRSDLLENFPSSDSSPFTPHSSLAILANLPYVPSGYLQQKKTPLTRGLAYEPHSALDGGEDGLDLYRKLLDQTRELTKKYPLMRVQSFYEIENAQKDVIAQEIHARFPYTHTSFTNDFAGHSRVIMFSI